MNTPFDKMFDFNRDGQLDWLERAARANFLMKMDAEMRQNDRLVEVGIDPDAFHAMSDSQKRETLANAGLDADGFGL